MWNTFSAVCWLFGRGVHDALGGKVLHLTLILNTDT
jgi:hypothetical protein